MENKDSLPHLKVPAPFPNLSQLDPVHSPTSHLLKIHFNIILPPTSIQTLSHTICFTDQSFLRNSYLRRRPASVVRPIYLALTASCYSSNVTIGYEIHGGRGIGGVVALILNFGTQYKCVVSFTLRPP